MIGWNAGGEEKAEKFKYGNTASLVMTCWVAVRKVPRGPHTMKWWAEGGRPRSKFSDRRLIELVFGATRRMSGDRVGVYCWRRRIAGENRAGHTVEPCCRAGGVLGSASLWRASDASERAVRHPWPAHGAHARDLAVGKFRHARTLQRRRRLRSGETLNARG